ncbi:MAG: hypothetical protein WEE20_06625, partial [Bacteroidota bacterium]
KIKNEKSELNKSKKRQAQSGEQQKMWSSECQMSISSGVRTEQERQPLRSSYSLIFSPPGSL